MEREKQRLTKLELEKDSVQQQQQQQLAKQNDKSAVPAETDTLFTRVRGVMFSAAKVCLHSLATFFRASHTLDYCPAPENGHSLGVVFFVLDFFRNRDGRHCMRLTSASVARWIHVKCSQRQNVRFHERFNTIDFEKEYHIPSGGGVLCNVMDSDTL